MAMNGIDRRDFLKGTGWMGLAAVAAGCQTGKAVAVVDDKPAAPRRRHSVQKRQTE